MTEKRERPGQARRRRRQEERKKRQEKRFKRRRNLKATGGITRLNLSNGGPTAKPN
tara:strand:- start:2570 stop:2737 length:168 start_codon:yes stop_codon:yes gene_type:complete